MQNSHGLQSNMCKDVNIANVPLCVCDANFRYNKFDGGARAKVPPIDHGSKVRA